MPTLATNSAARAQSGFTLIEMIAVLAVVGLATALVLPNWSKWLEQSMRRSEASDVLNQLRALRDRSALLGIDFELNSQTFNTLLPDARPAMGLPSGWSIESGSSLWIRRSGVCADGGLSMRSPRGDAWTLRMEPLRCGASLERML